MQKIDKDGVMRRIREATSDLHITAYEYAKHTSLSEVGIAKILSGKVKNPNETSIKAMIRFLQQHYQINPDWLLKEEGLMKDVAIPKANEFKNLTDTLKKKKMDELAVFIAHHEEEMMENPVFKSIVERRGYQLVIKKLKDVEVG